MVFPVRAQLRDARTDWRVEARIERLARVPAGELVRWVYRDIDEDSAWDWERIVQDSLDPSSPLESYGLFVGSDLEGLMSVDVQSKAPEGFLIIDYLAINPLHRPPTRTYKGSGLSLLALAIERSNELALNGQIWLESLPGARAFYESLGFARTGSISVEGHDTYVLLAEIAGQLRESLRKGKWIAL